MNALELWITANLLDRDNANELLNQLQDAGVISDNAVYENDVDHNDADRAVKWLKKNLKKTL